MIDAENSFMVLKKKQNNDNTAFDEDVPYTKSTLFQRQVIDEKQNLSKD